MNRQDIILNNNIFIADYYEFYDNKIKHYDDFIMLRYFNYYNDIAVDKDIYFIEKNIFNEYIKDLYINKKTTSNIISFPITETINGYSSLFTDFNSLYTSKSLFKEIIIDKDYNQVKFENDIPVIVNKIDDVSNLIYIKDIIRNNNSYKIYLQYGYDVYQLYSFDENNNVISDTKIPCDNINLYHPITIPKLNGIIHISSHINNINFHFLCEKYENFKSHSETEFEKDNNKYSEYITLYIPAISYIFDINNNLYYIEDINIINTINEVNNKFMKINTKTINNISYIKLALFDQPYKIDMVTDPLTKNNLYSKTYLLKKSQIYNNYLSYIINLTLYPVSNKKIKNNNIFIINELLSSNSCSFIGNYTFKLNCKLGFDENNIISVINTFSYPFENKFKSFGDAYKYFNNISEENYNNFTGLENIDDDILPEEIEEEINMPLNFVGYNIEMYSKLEFKSKFYDKKIQFNNKNFKIDALNNVKININNIFKSWDEMPDNIYVKSTFIDRYLGLNISGNMIIITKEWFKYLINQTKTYNVKVLNKLNNNIPDIINNANKKIINNCMKPININDKNNINFLNNITCVVKKENKNNNEIKIENRNNIKILYKPYFFRVNDLQNISLRANINQNIGINLSEYMTKVEAFKLIINNIEYIESGRNDAYVIFKINANDINKEYGKYDILNQDDEYISSGQYNIY